MNKTRREELNKLVSQLEEIKEGIEVYLDEEESYRDNMPENLVSSERYTRSEEAINSLQEAVDYLGDAINSICSAVE